MGPITYLNVSPEEAKRSLESGPYPPVTRWFHATTREVVALALAQGLMPACWRGRDTCCVFGYDSINDLPAYHGSSWILEIESAALLGQLKAWWVPAASIRAVWHQRSRHTLAAQLVYSPVLTDGCACELSDLTCAEQLMWRKQYGLGATA